MIASIATVALLLAWHAPQDLDELEAPCEVEAPTLAYRVEPFVDLYFTVRRLAISDESEPEIEGLDAAIAAARALQENLVGSLDWSAIDGLVGGCDRGEDAIRRFGTLPVTFGSPAHVDVLRGPAVELARALAAAEPAFRAELWPAHADEIAQARARIEGEFDKHFSRCIELAARDLAFTSMPLSIPFFLVHDAPSPGAMTQRDSSGRGVCFVSVKGREGTQLYEAILLRAMHALELATGGDTLDRMREKLERAGIDPLRPEWRFVPRALMLVEAGETIRRVVDPAHAHSGDVDGSYAELGPSALHVRHLWTEHLDGKIDREAALDAIVREVVGPEKR